MVKVSDTTNVSIIAGAIVLITTVVTGSYTYIENKKLNLLSEKKTTEQIYEAPHYAPTTIPIPQENNNQPEPINAGSVTNGYSDPITPLPIEAFNDPQSAASILKIIEKLGYIEGKTKPSAGKQYAYIFFDPRCPYCHKAFNALDSVIPIRWIPVPLLGNDPVPLTEKLLNNPTSDNLDTVFSGKDFATTETAAKSQLNVLLNNVRAFKVLTLSLSGQGVPIIIIPKTDGRIYAQVGFEDSDKQKIIYAYQKDVNQ